MQATLSTTASGKHFRTGTHTAGLTALAHISLESAVPSSQTLSEGVGLAHDAGNLLGALGLYCELLALPGVLREEHRHYAEELQLLSGRSRVLIDRLLHTRMLHPATTKREEQANAVPGLAPAQAEPVSVPDVIEGCRGLLDAVARRAIEVAYGAGAALPVEVPRESIERILVNLTKNAAEASAPENAITLRVTSRRDGVEPEQIVLTVEDKGCGLSSAAVKVLLGETPGRQPRAGTGLRGIGFRVVRELVGVSGGRLRMWSECSDSAAATGTTVEIAWRVAAERAVCIDKTLDGDYGANPMAERRELMLLMKQGIGSRARAGRASC